MHIRSNITERIVIGLTRLVCRKTRVRSVIDCAYLVWYTSLVFCSVPVSMHVVMLGAYVKGLTVDDYTGYGQTTEL